MLPQITSEWLYSVLLPLCVWGETLSVDGAEWDQGSVDEEEEESEDLSLSVGTDFHFSFVSEGLV